MKRNIEALTEGTFDLCILGGGITGAGVALDAATRGWRVALIDKSDFASGTSAASSKLIHGGLRYLEYGQFSLVHEALVERGRLLRNAPHLVAPLPFVLPFYEGQRVPPWQWRLGLTLYDLLAGHFNIARSRRFTARHLQAKFAGLRRQDLAGGALYYDALTDDARLCLTVLQTASRHGAVLANYVQAVGFEKQAGKIIGVGVRDCLSNKTRTISCRAVLNATGPWVDDVAQLAGDAHVPLLQATKGVHLITRDLGFRFAFLLQHPRDGRVFFVIPWLGKTMIGTTDTVPDTHADSLTVLQSEFDYLLDGYNHHFDPKLSTTDVLGTFAGLRPLIRASPGEPSARSREFRLHVSPSGLVSALGGKYTTYRQMAEDIVDFLTPRIGKQRRCRTRALRLAGTPEMPWPDFLAVSVPTLQKKYPDAADSIVHLLHRYGDQAADVLESIAAVPSGFERAHPEEPDLVGEQAYQRDREMATCPQDLFLRRSRIGMWRPELLRSASVSLAL